jgi:hypothetical protein
MLITNSERHWMCDFPISPFIATAVGVFVLTGGKSSLAWALALVVPFTTALWLGMGEFIAVRNDELVRLTLRGWQRRKTKGQKIVVEMTRGARGGGSWYVRIVGSDKREWLLSASSDAYQYGATVSRAFDIPIAQTTLELHPRIIQALAREEHPRLFPFNAYEFAIMFVLLFGASILVAARTCGHQIAHPLRM